MPTVTTRLLSIECTNKFNGKMGKGKTMGADKEKWSKGDTAGLIGIVSILALVYAVLEFTPPTYKLVVGLLMIFITGVICDYLLVRNGHIQL